MRMLGKGLNNAGFTVHGVQLPGHCGTVDDLLATGGTARASCELIESLGAEVEFIPPGCTGLVQPMDVGAKLCAQYNTWMMLQDPDKPTPSSSRRDVAGWIIEAERAVSNATIRNAWKRTGLSYFPDQPKE